jgi:hypothetical protein
MATFELSHQVATGKQQAKQLAKDLKALHQILKDTNTDTAILQDLNTYVTKAQELSTESFLFIEKEAEKYISPTLYTPFPLQAANRKLNTVLAKSQPSSPTTQSQKPYHI